MIGVGEGLVAAVGDGVLLAVALHYGGQDAERRIRRG